MNWFIEIVQDFDGTYYCSMTTCGKDGVEGIPEYVDYKTLRDAIREITRIEIPARNKLHWTQLGRKRYAYINTEQF